MIADSSLAAWTVVLPLAGAVGALLSPPQWRPTVGVTAMVAAAGAVMGLVIEVWLLGPQRHRLGGWAAPLGIELMADGLAALMLAVSAVVSIGAGIYATGYFSTADPGRHFWVLWLFLWTGLNAVFLSTDLFNLYVTLELLGLSAVALVALPGSRESAIAAMRYLLVSLLGSALFLTGVAMVYAAYGTISLALIAEQPHGEPAVVVALIAITIGLLMKTAIFPFHGWLPPAHASSPPPASALLSGVVVKASFYVLLRLWVEVFGVGSDVGLGYVAGALGTFAILWGSVLALRQRDLKLLVAYSTVAQLGYLMLIFPLLGGSSPAVEAHMPAAWAGGVYHALSHACAKAAMFLAAGTLAMGAGGSAMEKMSGLGRTMPLATCAFTLGGLSLAGLPPSGGFLAKWLLLEASLAGDNWLWTGALVVGSLLAAAYVLVPVRHLLESGKRMPLVARPPRRLEMAALGLALVAVALGIWAAPLLALLAASAPALP